ncbi:MAG: SDR family NAD(P)-dependent oxidoreductase [Acidobacteriota bacterium]
MTDRNPDPTPDGEISLQIFASNMPGIPDIGIAVAASRCGASGVVNLESIPNRSTAVDCLARASRLAASPVAVRIGDSLAELPDWADQLPANVGTIILPARSAELWHGVWGRLAAAPRRLLLEVTSARQAELARSLAVHGLIARGHESGGCVGEETTFVLLQRLLREHHLPVIAWGGVGLHTIGACYAAGASGVALDTQLLLTPQASVSRRLQAALERMDGDETICAGAELEQSFRFFKRPGFPGAEALLRAEEEFLAAGNEEGRREWQARLHACVDWNRPDTGVWPLGQDAAFALPLARRFHTLAGIVSGLRASAAEHVQAAQAVRPLAPHSPLARFHGIRYPVVQGPMTRVSDSPQFAAAVADAGGLPFLALALLRGPQVEELLRQTKELLGDRPWGAGILGFVPAALRAEQLAAVDRVRPPCAIIAGGRPDQAARLEKAGILTYLHVPSPALLDMFLEEGARRFVFEGRECGGHVGPRTSFVLWEAMIERLLAAIGKGVPAADLHVLFAGGIHDALSAAMVSVLAATLAAQGVRIGVLMGTAYLFTEEAVARKAITETFQDELLACRDTVTLLSGPGHMSRCAETPFILRFREERRRLLAAGNSVEEARGQLERLNLGRLRIATKGLRRGGGDDALETVGAREQRLEGMFMAGQVAALRTRTCTLAELHRDVSEHGSLLTQQLAVQENTALPAEPDTPPCDVAIVGMSCLLPGASDPDEFWANIIGRVDAVKEVPPERFDVLRYYEPDGNDPDRIHSKWGGFLDPVPFDPLRWGIPPAALSSIDPMQLLALVAVERAMKDAGYDERNPRRATTSVILGLSGGLGDLGIDYAVRASLPQLVADIPAGILDQLPAWTEDSFAGILLNVAAGRVANRFDFGGVNFTVDAACASSLAALCVAARELTTGASDMVVAGGVDTVQSPFAYLCFSSSQALSSRGRCSPFDQSADGIAISEGLSVVVLKRLADAERDGDRIYAVIRGIAGSSDGRGRGMTAPRAEGQKRALQRAWKQARTGAAGIGLMEAHGTGTVAGDAAEVTALCELLEEAGAPPRGCAIGSVKSMIGHTKAAAGLAGVVKVALALHHKVLPPTLHVTSPNSRLSGASSPLFANTETRPWLARPDGVPRRAGVSSFGFGGTNFHALLEEYTGDTRAAVDISAAERWPQELFCWAASSSASLGSALEEFQAALSLPGASLTAAGAALAATSSSETGPFRLAIVASSLAELTGKLDVARDWLRLGKSEASDHDRGIHLGSGSPAPKVAVLFPGQGSQYTGMLRELATYLPEMRETLETFDRELTGVFPQRLSSYIDPPSLFTEEERTRSREALTATQIAQPALGAVEIGLYRFLERVGLEPGAFAGHSYGEYVALCAAGVISGSGLIQLSQARGRAISESTGHKAGSMAAVSAGPEQVRAALAHVEGITLANLNAPRQTVIAGETANLDRALERLLAMGIGGQKLSVACAFHSPLMEPARASLEKELDRHTCAVPRTAVYSNTLGGAYPGDSGEIARILSRHLVLPVDFTSEIKAMYRDGARVFVEVGPKAVLTGLARDILEGTDSQFLYTDAGSAHPSPGRGLFQLLNVVGRLRVLGCNLRLEEIFRGRARPSRTTPSAAAPAWLVNGARACQATEPPPRKAPVPLRSVAAPPPPFAPLASVPPSAGVDAVMQQFQQLMGQFLSMQSAVMTQFLQGSPETVSSAEATLPALSVALPATASGDVRRTTPPLDLHSSDIRTQLLAIVRERTGYPIEMLDLDASLEADLGIDSIKRVEIIGEFRRSRPAEQQALLQGIGEKLTAARTLRDLLKHYEDTFGDREAAPVPGSFDTAAELVRLVGERTGYPVALLDPDAAIEADLGIDSIKRVEIIGALQRSLPEQHRPAVQNVTESLTGARTLREMADRLSAALHPAESHTGSERAIGNPRELSRFRLVSVPSPQGSATLRFHKQRVVILTDDETGVASAIAETLARQGERPVLLRHGEEPSAAPGAICANLTNTAAVHETVEFIRRNYGAAGALLHLLPLRKPAEDGADNLETWDRQLQLDLRSLYLLTREVFPDLENRGTARGAVAGVVTGRGGDFGLDPNDVLPVTHFAAADFMKSLALETHVRCKVVDVDPSEPAESLGDRLIQEILSEPHEGGALQAGLGRERHQIAVRTAPLKAGIPRRIGKDWVFLLTGGARGITAEIACALAEQRQPALILAGQSAWPGEESPDTAQLTDIHALKAALWRQLQAKSQEPPKPRDLETLFQRLKKDREILASLRRIREAGARCEYVSADVRDEPGFQALIERIYIDYGRLDVVIHGAGIIEDRLLGDKTPESFDRVVDTKARGAWLLSRALRPESLRSCIFMSSVSAAFGNRGQADYAAANGLMNGLALRLAAQWPCHVCAMNWGPWDQAGMVSEEVRARFRERGVSLISPAAGAAAVIREIESGSADPLVVLGDGPWSAKALPANEALAVQAGGGA